MNSSGEVMKGCFILTIYWQKKTTF